MRMISRLVIPISCGLRYDRFSFRGGHPWLGVHCCVLGDCCSGGVENN